MSSSPMPRRIILRRRGKAKGEEALKNCNLKGEFLNERTRHEFNSCTDAGIELRLNDEKRKQISVGDTIKFINTEDSNDTLRVKVVDLFLFSSFAELYDNLPLLNCGYNEDNINTASPDDMEMYYSREKQNKYGVVGIEISLL